MSTYSRYILRLVARPMITTILVALVALLAERMLRVVDLVVDWRGNLTLVFEMLGYLVPHYMGLALPVAFFLGILLTFTRLSREGELSAMYASGVGLVQLVRPLVGAGLVLALATGLLMSHIQPYARYAYRAAVNVLTSASFQQLLQDGIFTTVGRATYMVDQLSADKRGLNGVFIHSLETNGDSVTITSKTGTIDQQAQTDPLVLHLQNGVQQLLQPSGEELVVRFRNFQTTFHGADAMGARGTNEREMTLPELWSIKDEELPPGVDRTEVTAELHARLARIMALPVLPFMAVPLAIGGLRGQRSYGLVIGLALLVAFHHTLQLGESMVDDGKIPAWLGIWMPFGVLCFFALGLFLRAATRVPDPRSWTMADRVVDGALALFRRLRPAPAT